MINTIKEYFDLRSGIFAAVMMGGIVWWINAGYGPVLATTAALKQAAYTFFMGGLIIRFCHYLAGRSWSALTATTMATVLPTLVTTGATLLVHSLKGTPEPILSTLPVAVLSPLIFFMLAWKQRNTTVYLPNNH